jgi:formylglycine-generating enzyme required for sulfatase activity
MGSDKYYPQEAPAHRVTVDGFRIDRTPVTNRQFKEFVRLARQKTFAEIPADPKNYSGALPPMFYAGSLVFTPPRRPVDLENWGPALFWKIHAAAARWTVTTSASQRSKFPKVIEGGAHLCELLPPPPAGSAPCRAGSHVNEPSRVRLRPAQAG